MVDPSRYRFRQVPTFGRSTIRKFGGNVSAMKKLAGRDFEDLLQVGAPSSSPLISTTKVRFPRSVGFQSSRASFQEKITRSCSTLYSTWPRGMPMQNSACTRPIRSSHYGHKRKNSAACSAVMPTICAPSTRQNRFQERLPLLIAAELRRERRPPRNPDRQVHRTRKRTPRTVQATNNSTSRHTRSMHSVTTQTTSSSSAQPTAFRHSRFVLLLSFQLSPLTIVICSTG